VTARLEGGQGVHGVSFLSSRVAEMPQYFRSKGIGLLASPDSRRVPHPRALMGARFIFLERPHPDDPRYRRVA